MSQVGVADFGCLGNLHPGEAATFYFEVAGVSEVGTGPVARSPDHIGQVC